MDFKDKFAKIDGVLWLRHYGDVNLPYSAHCPFDRFELSGSYYDKMLTCEDCTKVFNLPRNYTDASLYVESKLKAKTHEGFKVVNFDDEAVPLAESKDKDDSHFVIAKLVKTKVGKRLIVYAGEQGAADKTQIFIEPEIKRLAFDQNNIHPSEIFVVLEAQFSDGQTQTMKRKEI